jgi:hypothetical protein
MKNLVVVMGIVSVVTAALSTTATCLILGRMARAASLASSACVDSATVEGDYSTTTCRFPEQAVEVYAVDKSVRLVKCVCPRAGSNSLNMGVRR